MDQDKIRAHFPAKYLLAPTNPVIVNVIGAGATGSQAISALFRMHKSLRCLDHPGLFVRLFDDDVISDINTANQLFDKTEIGLPKSVALINRANRSGGMNWQGHHTKYHPGSVGENDLRANITISCVDTASARFSIADTLSRLDHRKEAMDKPLYWMDFGNGQSTGQMLIGTVAKIRQPGSQKYEGVESLPTVTQEYEKLLSEINDTSMPSCSHVEALQKQDLFINPSLVSLGCSILYNMIRSGFTIHRGLFMNLHTLKTESIKI